MGTGRLVVVVVEVEEVVLEAVESVEDEAAGDELHDDSARAAAV